jgi:hypothetical protein
LWKNCPKQTSSKSEQRFFEYTWASVQQEGITILRICHQSLRVTPAMEAGISDHVWELDEVIALLEVGRN